ARRPLHSVPPRRSSDLVDRQEVRVRKDAGIPPPSQRRFYGPEPAPAAPPPMLASPPPASSADFRHSTVFIDGAALATTERLHDEDRKSTRLNSSHVAIS